MAGRIQLETSGPQDAFFTDDPEYTYFVKNFKKHANYASFIRDLDVEGEVEFGNTVKCTIPQNQGDLIKTISLKIDLNEIDQTIKSSLHSNTTSVEWNESIGHAMIEYIELLIGGKVIQRLTSDFLAIYFDNYVTQTKQNCLSQLVRKPPDELSGSPAMSATIGSYPGYAEQNLFVDIPFYFYNNPELAIPICAINKQEVEINVKLRDIDQCIHSIRSDSPYTGYILYTGLKPTNLIKSLKVTTEMVSLTDKEKKHLNETPIDYIITQVQESRKQIDQGSTPPWSTSIKHRLDFINPVKELFFIIQGTRKTVNGFYNATFDYDNSWRDQDSRYINYEQLKKLELQLDDSVPIEGASGEVINLRAVQSGIHHSRTQLFRRYYSYSFALEPERWYPTGQVNFSLIKDQVLKLTLNAEDECKRELRVLAHSYNILRVENGIAKTLF